MIVYIKIKVEAHAHTCYIGTGSMVIALLALQNRKLEKLEPGLSTK